jgi:hypothetical protein
MKKIPKRFACDDLANETEAAKGARLLAMMRHMAKLKKPHVVGFSIDGRNFAIVLTLGKPAPYATEDTSVLPDYELGSPNA